MTSLSRGDGLDSHLEQQRLHLLRVKLDLVQRPLPVGTEFEAVERAFACQRLALVLLLAAVEAEHVGASANRRQQRIQAQALMVVDVLVAQGDAHDPLAQQHGQLVLDEKGIAVIGEKPGKLLAETPDPVHFPQQQRAALAGQMPAAEIRFDPAAAKPLKCEGLLSTLCLALGGVHALFFGLRIKGYSATAPRSSATLMRYAG